MTIWQHVAAARRGPDGMGALAAALRSDPGLAADAAGLMKEFDAMERAGRMKACWVSRVTKDTLAAALAAGNEPGVPAGG